MVGSIERGDYSIISMSNSYCFQSLDPMVALTPSRLSRKSCIYRSTPALFQSTRYLSHILQYPLSHIPRFVIFRCLNLPYRHDILNLLGRSLVPFSAAERIRKSTSHNIRASDRHSSTPRQSPRAKSAPKPGAKAANGLPSVCH
jgi:hypothetical protein